MQKKKEGVLKLKGKVVEKLPGANFRVEVDLPTGSHEIIGYISGKMKMYYIKLQIDDMVDIEVSPHDLTKGRITYRH